MPSRTNTFWRAVGGVLTSTVQSAMTITSVTSAGVEDDEPFDQMQLSFKPEDPNYGKAISCAKHGPYYMHLGDRVCSICFKNITTFMRRLCGRYHCMPCQISRPHARCDCSTRYMTTFDEPLNPNHEHELKSVIDR